MTLFDEDIVAEMKKKEEDEMIAKEIADNKKYGEKYGMTGKRWKVARRRKDFKWSVEEFQAREKIEQPKCISDRILLYLRYGLDEVKTRGFRPHYAHPSSQVQHYDGAKFSRAAGRCMDIYQDHIRGEAKYTAQNPVTMAASVLYMGCLESGLHGLTHHVVTDIFSISESSLNTNFRKLLKDFPDTPLRADRRTGQLYLPETPTVYDAAPP